MSPLPTPQAGAMPSNHNPAALAASAVVCARRSALLRATMLNTNAAARWMQVFDAAAVPADAAVPILSIPVAAGALATLDLGVHGKLFKAGIVICTSSTAATKTIGAADALIEATFVQGA